MEFKYTPISPISSRGKMTMPDPGTIAVIIFIVLTIAYTILFAVYQKKKFTDEELQASKFTSFMKGKGGFILLMVFWIPIVTVIGMSLQRAR